jgi:hypothetical protein
MTPVSPIGLDRTSARCKASHPEETVTYPLPGIHREPSLLVTQKRGLLQPQVLLQIISFRSLYLDLYLKGYNSNFFNDLKPKTTTDLVVVAPTSVVAPPLSYPQLLF